MKALIAPLLLTLMAVCTHLQAQSPPVQFYNLTTEEGLSGDVVHSLCQDKNGFIWIGTQHGLDRFDGYSFRHYMYELADSNSISGNQVYKILQGENGILWLATNKGLSSLNRVDEKITRYHIPNVHPPAAMSDMVFANDTLLIINANTALYSFNIITGMFSEIQMPAINYSINMFSRFFSKNKQGKIFISTGKDVLQVDWLHNKAITCPPATIAATLPVSFAGINQVYFDAKDNVWCFGQNDVAVYSNAKNNNIHYPFTSNLINAPENIITGFLEEPGKKLWICTGAGLVVYDYIKKCFYQYRKQPGNQASLTNNRITGIIKSGNGLYWVGTYGNGICSLTQNVKFNSIIFNTSSSGESFIVYKSVKLPFNKVLVHTLARQDFIISERNKIEPAEQNTDKFPLDSVVQLATGNSLQSFSSYDRQFLCSLYNAKKYGRKNNYYVAVQDISLAKPLFTDANNKLWLLDGNRLFNGSRYIATTVNQYISYATATGDHDILMATGAGLFVFSLKTMKLTKVYLHDDNDVYSLGSDYIRYLLPDASGNCWIATADGGIDYLDAATNRFHHYTTKDGLPDNSTYMIVPDKKGRLWISSNNGLSCFDTSTRTFVNYDKSDGLINNEFNSLSAWADNNGNLYFGGMKGIDYFSPQDFNEIKKPPQLYLSGFKVYDSLLPIRTHYYLQTNDNNITIQFTTNDFLQASKMFYRWKLGGVDEDWVVKKAGNSALYNKLPPGSYAFAVQASYDNKCWSEPVAVEFKIATPWYQTWWFLCLLSLLIVFITVMLVRYRLRQQLKVFLLRYRIQRDLHDDIGATLSSIKVYTEIMKTNPGNTITADLINNNASEMIERLEVIIWAANPLNDNIEHFTEKINRFAAPLLRSKKTAFTIAVNGISKTLVMPGEVRQHFYLIVKEAVNNVAKYAEASFCNITIAIQNHTFLVKIEDDGIGFNTDMKKHGNGLTNMQSRTAQLGGEIKINSMPGKGTSVIVALQYPFKTAFKSQQKNKNYFL